MSVMGQQSLQIRPAVAGKPQELLHCTPSAHPKYITSHFPGCTEFQSDSAARTLYESIRS